MPSSFNPQIDAVNLLAPLADSRAETDRVLSVCNACRYCEGLCPVFPELARSRKPSPADVDYLANLCHGCGACLDVCQYAPPHPFAIEVPAVLAAQRLHSYQQFAWPGWMATLLQGNPVWMVVGLLVSLLVLLLLVMSQVGVAGLWRSYAAAGGFYAVMPHGTMVLLAAASFGFALLSLGVSIRRFSSHLALERRALLRPSTWGTALAAAATLRYLGDQQGCQTYSPSFSSWRRVWHHVMAYGFVLCFAATCAGTWYHYVLGLTAPYGWLSVPVVLGVVGGLGLIVGPLGMLLVGPRPPGSDPHRLNASLLLLLSWVSATGLGLLLWRDQAAMPVLLIVHLSAVFTLFVLLPFSKFVHAPFRFVALLKLASNPR